MNELGSWIAAQRTAAELREIAARTAEGRQRLIDEANSLCDFCKGSSRVSTCRCKGDCGSSECGYAEAYRADWLFNPRALAEVPVFRARVA